MFYLCSASECNHGFLLGIFSSCWSKKTDNSCLVGSGAFMFVVGILMAIIIYSAYNKQ